MCHSIAVTEKNRDIEEEKAGGKFPEILRKEKLKMNFCNNCRVGISYVNFIV